MSNAPVPDEIASPPGEPDDDAPLLNPRIALVLAIVPGLFGFLGIGYLYMRKWGMGIGMMLFGWVLLVLPAIGTLRMVGPDLLPFLMPVTGWPLKFAALAPEGD